MSESTSEPKRLYRSNRNKILAGICGGVAEYFNFDPTVVRFVWVFLTLLGGSGILLYLIAFFIMPSNPAHFYNAQSEQTPPQPPSSASAGKGTLFAGIALICIGAMFLADNLGVHYWIPFWRFTWEAPLAIIFIVLGIYLMMKKPSPVSQQNNPAPVEQNYTPQKQFRKSLRDKKIAGVCGGIAEYFNIDSTVVRLAFVAGMLLHGIGLLLYIILAIVAPKEHYTPAQFQQ
ncbi:MAG: PspC domain-containing protein [Bacteroidota bacterium]